MLTYQIVVIFNWEDFVDSGEDAYSLQRLTIRIKENLNIALIAKTASTFNEFHEENYYQFLDGVITADDTWMKDPPSYFESTGSLKDQLDMIAKRNPQAFPDFTNQEILSVFVGKDFDNERKERGMYAHVSLTLSTVLDNIVATARST